MSHVIAIDPGPVRSAMVVWTGSSIEMRCHEPNGDVISRLSNWARVWHRIYPLAIEQVACYGMPVGAEVFETVYWTGRFSEAYGALRVHRVPRMDVKMHLCHSSRAKDANIRQALVDRFGKPGTKANPGVLYGIKNDLWAALALAVTWWDKNAPSEKEVEQLHA